MYSCLDLVPYICFSCLHVLLDFHDVLQCSCLCGSFEGYKLGVIGSVFCCCFSQELSRLGGLRGHCFLLFMFILCFSSSALDIGWSDTVPLSMNDLRAVEDAYCSFRCYVKVLWKWNASDGHLNRLERSYWVPISRGSRWLDIPLHVNPAF